MSLNTRLLLVAIVLAASLATMAMVSNPAFAGTGFKNKAECIKFLTQNYNVPPNVAAKSCNGPFAG
jgi:ABC-type cobalt transport system substrate-binding protein